MKISEYMTRDVRTISPDRSIREAAQVMSALDLGALPVGENDRLVGMITDRDIAVRAVAEGLDCETPIRQVMTQDVKYCFEDEFATHVADNMGEIQVRRLPVLDRSKRLVGIVALADLACGGVGTKPVNRALAGISRQGGQHSQTPQAH
ncbi:CBS domain-containing protein [Solimonas fluminis]|uniref:CBS domain-containing protein n=1 Tax=Solimonas fluminis TaxID=2086571 RepID=A0A2S5TJ97_9GAMM|nr:CBS domain-containing protein [Solimonas fluminis]PPE75054.1 CBS domain-containing protein [Solimonas fluminis]